ncbi:MAG: sigma-70 family RNA polymerase sigma factor [Planctomycetota bacterium]|nr:sigma-70 family RNA polymerase sigma factor [Planctomycetota bacterium]
MAGITRADHRTRIEQCVDGCARRAWAVAFALLRDRDEAFDAVQQACLVLARKPEAIPQGSPWPWFGVVVANEARNIRRKRRPQTNRLDEGVPMSLPPSRDPDPVAAAQLGETEARLREALDALPPKEREAVYLTHVAGMSQVAAAEALDRPRATVSLHARRGVARLEAHLARPASRLTRALALVPLVSPPGGWSGATSAWTQAALGALPATAAVTSTTLGAATVMTSKTVWIVSLTAALGLGVLGGRYVMPATAPSSETQTANAPDADMRADAAGTDAAPLEGRGVENVETLRQKLHDARMALARARTHADTLERALEAKRDPLAVKTGPVFTFGSLGQLEAIREANWREMATAARAVEGGVLEIFKRTEKGEAVPKALYLTLQENVEKMRKYEYRTIDKIPTSAKHNGELTHPITVANLLAAILSEVGLPLDDTQVADINRLGNAFDKAYEGLVRRFDADTPRVRRILEEYRLKGRFREDLKQVLTASQREAVVNPETEGLAGLDLHDPTLMILHTSPVLTGADRAEVGAKLKTVLAKKFAVGADDAGTLDAAVEAWLGGVARILEPVDKLRVKHYSYEQGLAAGEATALLYDRMLRDVPLTDAARKALLDDFAFYVPRLIRTP